MRNRHSVTRSPIPIRAMRAERVLMYSRKWQVLRDGAWVLG